MIQCLKCKEVDGIQKAGFNRGRQRFRCRHCDYYFNLPNEEKQPIKSNHQTTIKDLASELGLSPSTISKALHNHPDISPVTRKAIIDLAQKMEYYPNQLAYNLVKSKSRTIGIVVPLFFSTFFPSIIIGAQEVLSAAGYNLLICQSNEDYNLEKKNIETLLLLTSVVTNSGCINKKLIHLPSISFSSAHLPQQSISNFKLTLINLVF